MSEPITFSRKFKASIGVFIFFFVTIPYFFFDKSEKFIGDKKPLDWVAEKGWWSTTGIKLMVAWLLLALVAAIGTYGILYLLERLARRIKRTEPTLTVVFKNEQPYTEDSGPSGLGLYYSNRWIGIISSIGGKVTVKVPAVRLENGQIKSNVFLRPSDNQPEDVDAGDPGYWRVVQWNTSEQSIKLVHKGKESYYLGAMSRFEILAKCSDVSERKWVITEIWDNCLLFKLSDKENDDFTESEREQQCGGRERQLKGENEEQAEPSPERKPPSEIFNDLIVFRDEGSLLLKKACESYEPDLRQQVARWESEVVNYLMTYLNVADRDDFLSAKNIKSYTCPDDRSRSARRLERDQQLIDRIWTRLCNFKNITQPINLSRSNHVQLSFSYSRPRVAQGEFIEAFFTVDVVH